MATEREREFSVIFSLMTFATDFVNTLQTVSISYREAVKPVKIKEKLRRLNKRLIKSTDGPDGGTTVRIIHLL